MTNEITGIVSEHKSWKFNKGNAQLGFSLQENEQDIKDFIELLKAAEDELTKELANKFPAPVDPAPAAPADVAPVVDPAAPVAPADPAPQPSVQ